MISYEQALQVLVEQCQLLPEETWSAAHALHRVTTQPAYSQETLPPFDNSAMDGFAVLAAECAPGIRLDIVGLTAAGDAPCTDKRKAMSAHRIMTGAPLPAGFDAVVPVEMVQKDEARQSILLSSDTHAGVHIRLRGEDFKAGELVVPAGVRLNPAHIMALAATGNGRINVRKRLSAVIFATGSELVDDCDVALSAGHIRNSNSPFLQALLQKHDVDVRYAGLQKDDLFSFERALHDELSRKPTLILSTGAVSAGDFDFVPEAIVRQGGEILFHKVAIKPGKPILLARFACGTLFIGLPGNPISTAIGARFFVLPLLRAMNGQAPGRWQQARLVGDVHKRSELREFRKAQVYLDEQGVLCVRELSGQESHKIAPLMLANAWIILPDLNKGAVSGETVMIAGLLGEQLAL